MATAAFNELIKVSSKLSNVIWSDEITKGLVIACGIVKLMKTI